MCESVCGMRVAFARTCGFCYCDVGDGGFSLSRRIVAVNNFNCGQLFFIFISPSPGLNAAAAGLTVKAVCATEEIVRAGYVWKYIRRMHAGFY